MVGACVAGVCLTGGLHGKGGHAWQGGVHGRGYVWQEKWPLQWTERILLEYILVI